MPTQCRRGYCASIRSMFALIVGLATMMMVTQALAARESYSNAINASSWSVKSSVLSCQLSHKVPYFGSVVFRTRAGEASAFFIRGSAARFKAGESDLLAATPVWMAQQRREKIASVALKKGSRPIWLGTSLTERMLVELNAGREIRFVHPTWYQNGDSEAILSISNIGFREAYERYLKCLPGLIPRNYDQLKRSSLQFSIKQGDPNGLPSAVTTKLDHILTLLKHDKAINHFMIDAHTDGEGTRKDNLELSKVKAEQVAKYLSDRGVPEDQMEIRWHGERYPIASNETKAGRAKNSRVTVRLDKIKPEPAPTEVSANASP